MARVARPLDPLKINFLKEQINDPSYLQGAVESIARRITDRLLGFDEEAVVHRSASHSRNENAFLLRDRE